jgi:hypothetical protein
MLQKFLSALTAGQNRLAGLSLRVFSALSLLSNIRLGRKNSSEKLPSLFNLDVSSKERNLVTMTPGRHPRLEEWAKRTASLFNLKFGLLLKMNFTQVDEMTQGLFSDEECPRSDSLTITLIINAVLEFQWA